MTITVSVLLQPVLRQHASYTFHESNPDGQDKHYCCVPSDVRTEAEDID